MRKVIEVGGKFTVEEVNKVHWTNCKLVGDVYWTVM